MALRLAWVVIPRVTACLVLALTAHAQLECSSTSFCSALPSSTGLPASIGAASCSLEDQELQLKASPVPDQFGLFFHSASPAGGGAGLPFGDGLRCVGGAGDEIFRMPVGHAEDGVLLGTLDLAGAPAAAAAIQVGSTHYFQAWFRDPAAGGSGFNLSNGLEVEFRLPRLNLLHIVLDDVGLDCLRMYHDQNAFDGDDPRNQLEHPGGSNLYPWTPVLDRLAGEGVRFNQFRVNPTCSTTRATMATGRYAFRNGIGSLVAPDRVGSVGELGVGPGNEEYSIGTLAQGRGYRTGWTGKWHLSLSELDAGLGGLPGRGYPHVLEFGGWQSYWILFSNLDAVHVPPPVFVPGVSAGPDVLVPRGYWNYYSFANFGDDPLETEYWNVGRYATDQHLRRTAELIQSLEQADPEGPWFVTVSLSAAHSPYGDVPDPQWISTLEYLPAVTPYGLTVPGGTGAQSAWRGHTQLLEALDSRLGAMFATLGGVDAVLEDTMVLITGDNGTTTPILASAQNDHGKDIGSVYSRFVTPSTNHFKHSVYEFGVRVPLIVAGPLVVDGGRSSDALIDGVDVHATLVELAGVDLASATDGRPHDGVSFLPLLTGERDDLQHIQLGRQASFTERFSPNGDPNTIVPPVFNQNSRLRAYVGRTASGWFKLVRRLGQSGLDEDELYHLYSGPVPSMATAVDPYELVDLAGDPAHAEDLERLRLDLAALLASEP